MTSIDICNIALSFLRKPSIVSFEQETESSRQCKQFYDITRKGLLRDYTWNFAISRCNLAQLDYDHPDWMFIYTYPAKCLNVRRIVGEEGDFHIRGINENNEFDSFLVDGGVRVLACNVENAKAIYTADIVDASLFSDDFVMAIAHLMATKMSIPLNADSNTMQQNMALFEYYILKSKTNNANERNMPFEYSDTYIRVRD